MALINPFPKAPWFSIDEDQYLMYILKGYEIKLSDNKKCVYFLLDGKYHREDGPAGIWKDGTVEYWVNDCLYIQECYRDIYLSKLSNTKDYPHQKFS